MVRSTSTVLVTLACFVPVLAGDRPAPPLDGAGAVRVRAAPHAFGRGLSPFDEREPGATTLDEAYEAMIAGALIEAGVVVDSEASAVVETWVYADGEAAIHVRPEGDSAIAWSATVVRRGDAAGVALLEGLAEATARVLTGAAPLEGFEALTVSALLDDLDLDDLERADRAVTRLARLRDPEGLARLERWGEENDLDLAGGLDDGHGAARRSDTRVQWHWNRALAALQRGETGSAVDHLRAAVDLQPDHRSAHGALGDVLLRGEGVAPDVEAGLAHLRRAGTLGSADAAYQLGYLYAKGERVLRDLVEALAWFERGARQGHEPSIAARDALAAMLTPEQRADAESRIAPDESGVPSSDTLLAGVGGVTNPELIESSLVQPEYPETARQARLTGNVILQAVITRDGTVRDVKVLRVDKPNLGFEYAAVKAVEQWRYRPSTFRGDPVEVYFTINVAFTLH